MSFFVLITFKLVTLLEVTPNQHLHLFDLDKVIISFQDLAKTVMSGKRDYDRLNIPNISNNNFIGVAAQRFLMDIGELLCWWNYLSQSDLTEPKTVYSI